MVLENRLIYSRKFTFVTFVFSLFMVSLLVNFEIMFIFTDFFTLITQPIFGAVDQINMF